MGNFLMWLVQLLWEYLFPVKTIPTGKRGARWWFGKICKKDLAPGVYMYVPYFHRIEDCWACYQEVDTLTQHLTTKDGVSVTFSANVGFTVFDAALWWTKIYNFDTTVERKIRKVLFTALLYLDYEDVRATLPVLVGLIHKQLQEHVSQWGVNIVEVGFTDFAKTKVYRLINEPGNFIFNQAHVA